ncbi:dephospho-CoA kinase [Yoonia litorea]|uniref:Dephospho-CoA kinase n=1 Tax=Yoonia litorea TaxID=1123755 RepID=A0A1I6MVR9_9RHOB|nr:dephospho-CoA kinase [Yoonia litorea]SFS19796.1 dephospho-CoA kinase [Yoonia litorea]
MTHLLGLTGSIGMGKSTTAEMFREEGIPVWDADATVHRLYGKGGAAVASIAAAFPSAVQNDAVDRSALKSLIANDPEVIGRLEKIVHPLVAADRAAFLAKNDGPLVVFDIPLLFETGADAWLSSVLVVTAPPEVQRERVLARGQMDSAMFEQILSRQMPDQEKRSRADHIIETLTLDDTRLAVQNLIRELTGKTDARDRT